MVIFPILTVQAASDLNYKIMEGIPGFFNPGSVITFPELVSVLYKLGIWVVGIAALFMITVGGFMYATSAGNTSTANSAKNIIKDSILGLVLAMTAYFVLNFINPDLVNTNSLKTKDAFPEISAVPSVPVTPETSERIKQMGLSELAQEILTMEKDGKIVLEGSAAADCKDATGVPVSPQRNIQELANSEPMTACNGACASGDSPCVGKVVPPKELLEAIIGVAQLGKYRISSLSGGKHGMRSSHYTGNSLDIIPSGGDWNSYVTALKNSGFNPDQTFCEDPKKEGGNIKSLNCKIKHHIHASFLRK